MVARREITNVDLIIDARAVLAEGPVWDGEAGRLIWVDIPQHRVHVHYPESGRNHLFDVGQPVGIAVPRTGGGLALAVRDGFAELDEEDSQLTMIAPVEADRRDQRMNDGACDPAGRFWAGTMSDGEPRAGSGAVYRLEIDGEVTRVVEGVTISNGIGWSPDDRLMYYVDTATQDIDRFDFDLDTGRIPEPSDPGVGSSGFRVPRRTCCRQRGLHLGGHRQGGIGAALHAPRRDRCGCTDTRGLCHELCLWRQAAH